VNLFGFEPFPASTRMWVGGIPTTLQQASSRPVYGIANAHKNALPTFLWGDVSFVFNNSHVNQAAILAPFDTGDFSCQCGMKSTDELCKQWSSETSCSKVWCCKWYTTEGCLAGWIGRGGVQSNCSHNNESRVGVIGASDHLLEPYAYAYGEELATMRLVNLFSRSLLKWAEAPEMSLPETAPFYFEADVAANIPLPNGVKFIVVSLPSLFGSDVGQQVRSMAARLNWPLLWALGPNNGGVNPNSTFTWPAVGRVADAEVFRNMSVKFNLTEAPLPPLISAFDKLWKGAAQARDVTNGTLSPTLAADIFNRMMNLYSPVGMSLEPVRADLCQSPHLCIGVQTLMSSKCVCLVT